MSLKEELISSFDFIGVTPTDEVLNLSMDLCNKFNMTAEDLVDSWSSFTVSNKHDIQPTVDLLRIMERNDLKPINPSKEHKQTFVEDEFPKSSENDVDSQSQISSEKYMDEPVDEQTNKNFEFPLSSKLTQTYNFGERTNSLTIALCHTRKDKSQIFQAGNAVIGNAMQNIRNAFCFMNENYQISRSKYNCLTERLGAIMVDKFRKKIDNYVHFYGRIQSEGKKKLSATSVYLQMIDGTRYKLQFKDNARCSLFTGQVVAVCGNFLTKSHLLVEEIVYDATPDPLKEESKCKDNVDIVIAAGPFTVRSAILYEPLEELIKYVIDRKPHVLVLFGPFLEETHDFVTSETNVDFGANFETTIELIADALRTGVPHLKIVVVPSAKDIHHFPIYPTPPYRTAKKHANVRFVPDPFMLNVNGIAIGMTNTDILLHMAKHECGINPPDKRMVTLSSHLIKQRCFYPVYPFDGNIDVELLFNNAMMNVKPDVLILPSTLVMFVEKVNDTLVVNPQRLMKPNASGTFAHLQIDNSSDKGDFFDRLDCRIINI